MLPAVGQMAIPLFIRVAGSVALSTRDGRQLPGSNMSAWYFILFAVSRCAYFLRVRNEPSPGDRGTGLAA